MTYIITVHLKDVDIFYEQWTHCPSHESDANSTTSKRARAMNRIQQSLIAAQELGDEKMQVVTQLQEIIDLKTRQLDADFKNLDYGIRDDPGMASSSPKDTHPSSPASLSLVGNHHMKMDIKNEDGSSTSTSASIQSSNADRASNAASLLIGLGSGSTSSNNGGGDRSWKRARRGRETVSLRNAGTANNSNQYVGTNKGGSAMDIDRNDTLIGSGGSSGGGAGASKAGTSGSTSGQSNIGASSSLNAQNNKKQSNAGKKKKRKSGRSQSGMSSGGNGTGGGNGGNGGNGSGSAGNSGHQGNALRHDDTPPMDETIDPDEPTYCLCDQISFGEMILCDNDLCPIEWFHFSCVSLTTKPKGKWFCPNCRGERPSVMKPKQQFLKELERYNREKEEKC